MQNLLDTLDNESDSDNSSFCSTCDSKLRSMRSIGVPSILNSNDEYNIETEIENNSYTCSRAITVADNMDEFAPSTLTASKYFQSKKRKHIDSFDEGHPSTSNIGTAKCLNNQNNVRNQINFENAIWPPRSLQSKIPTLSNVVQNKTIRSNLCDILNHETSKTTAMSMTTRHENLGALITRINHFENLENIAPTNIFLMKPQNKTDNNAESNISNQREKIISRLKSILHLCRYINILREVILKQAQKNQAD